MSVRVFINLLMIIFFSESCMANDDIEEQLLYVKSIIQDESDSLNRCSELSKIVDYELPLEFCNILHNAKEFNLLINSGKANFFWNLNILSYDELLIQYKNKTKKNTFFSDWGIDDGFNVNGYQNVGGNFNIEYDLDGELQEPIDIKNVKSFVPLFYSDGHYILYGVGQEKGFAGLLFVSREGFGTMLAPSLLSHIENLIEGLRSGVYYFDEDNLVYPANWFDRKKAKAAGVMVDEPEKVDGESDIEYPSFVEKWLDQWRK